MQNMGNCSDKLTSIFENHGKEYRKHLYLFAYYLLLILLWCNSITYAGRGTFRTYSSVPNRSACTFINFEKKFPPAWPYLGLHVYWFWEKNPPCTFIWVALKFKIKSFKLKTACNFVKKSKFVVNNSTDMSK